jgi:hypothetical protein
LVRLARLGAADHVKALRLVELGERVELLRLVERGAHNLPQHILAERPGAGGALLDGALGLAGLGSGICSEALR